jgi:hypothetical protein
MTSVPHGPHAHPVITTIIYTITVAAPYRP